MYRVFIEYCVFVFGDLGDLWQSGVQTLTTLSGWGYIYKFSKNNIKWTPCSQWNVIKWFFCFVSSHRANILKGQYFPSYPEIRQNVLTNTYLYIISSVKNMSGWIYVKSINILKTWFFLPAWYIIFPRRPCLPVLRYCHVHMILALSWLSPWEV